MKKSNPKRVKISSEQELRNWLDKNPGDGQRVMLVTYNKASCEKHVSREQIRDALDVYGWDDGPRTTLNGNLIGHVISKHQSR